jgi:GT2 family glycosyltransferase
MSLPLVSYIIISMNRSAELAECLANVRLQEYPHKEIIVVDNGSTDDTGHIVRNSFPEVRYIYLEKNLGVAGGRNKGTIAAQGDLCIFIDDDAHFVDPGATGKAVDYFLRDERLACLGFTIRNAFTGIEEYKAIPRVDKKSLDHDYQCAYFCGAGFALRRQVFLGLGMFWEGFFYGGEELDYSYRLLDQNYRIIHSAAIIISHREVQQARPKGQWIYFNARNRCWLAWRNLPWPHAVSMTLSWWGQTCFTSLRYGLFVYFMRGARDAVAGLPEVIQERQRISKDTVKLLKTLSGRRWY